MAKFANAVGNMTSTTNGMSALKSSNSVFTDLFFGIGAARNNRGKAALDFMKAFNADKLIATKLLFWARDVRGGAGERDTFRELAKQLEMYAPEVLVKNMHLIPKFGRWDDMLVFSTNVVKQAAYAVIARTLSEQTDGWQLCSKWMPRKGSVAVELRNFMGLSPKAYRKMLVNGTNVVETAMCSNDWSSIQYSHVPSVAAKIYQRAFGRHDPSGYTKYREGLTNGTEKVNASAIFPHDVIKGTDSVVADAQWKALPNYMEGAAGVLPMADVSGSMECPAGGNTSTTCMDVSIALSIYIAEKQKGAFNGLYLTFSAKPTLTKLPSGDIHSKAQYVRHHGVGYNTNIEAAFAEILRVAKSNNVPQEDMPKILLIFSDMQFDQASRNDAQVSGYGPTVQQMAANKYRAAGYELPKIVYWNLNSHNNVPVTCDEQGTALVSGFSPAIMKAVLAGNAESFTPFSIMMEAINDERYNEVTV